MSDLISRADLMEKAFTYEIGKKRTAKVVFLSDVQKAKAVDAVEVVHGEWNETADCSVCGMPAPTDDRIDFINIAELNYCPYCGARMDGCSNEET